MNIILNYFQMLIRIKLFSTFVLVPLWWPSCYAGHTAVLTARVRPSHDCRFSVQCKVIALPDFYDTITGATEFIVNSVKIVNMPRHDYLFFGKEKVLIGILYTFVLAESHNVDVEP